VFFSVHCCFGEDIVVFVGCVDTFGLVDLRYGFGGRRTRARMIEWVVLCVDEYVWNLACTTAKRVSWRNHGCTERRDEHWMKELKGFVL
jgi:hypothetical protein